jgi:hypothetical protein
MNHEVHEGHEEDSVIEGRGWAVPFDWPPRVFGLPCRPTVERPS